MIDKNVLAALGVLYIVVVADIIAGVINAERNDNFNKEKFKKGIIKAIGVFAITFLLGLAFQFDSTLVFNDTPLVEYLISLYRLATGVILVQVVTKVAEMLGIYIPKGDE